MKRRKIRSLILSIAFALLCSFASANEAIAQITWAHVFRGNFEDEGHVIKQTNDGDYIIAGLTYSSQTMGWIIWILKLNASGNIVWQRTYGSGYEHNAYSIQQTSDNGYIVAGYTNEFGAGNDDAWILKLDSFGNILWQKTYGGSNHERAYSIQQTSDGGYIVAGYTWSFGTGNHAAWVLKLDFSGNIIWQKAYSGDNPQYAYSISQINDGGYIVAGYAYVPSAGGSDALIFKLDSEGNIIWQKIYGENKWEYAQSILQTSDGGYIVAGYNFPLATNNPDGLVFKLDPFGNIVWQKIYGGNNPDFLYSIQQISDGGYIVVGGTSSFGSSNYDAWVIKLDTSGNIVWQKAYGESENDFAYYIQQTNDGGYVVAGTTYSFGTNLNDMWVFKIDSEGNMNSSCTFINSTNAFPLNYSGLETILNATASDTSITGANTPVIPANNNGMDILLCNSPLTQLRPYQGAKPVVNDSSSPMANGILEPGEDAGLEGTLENFGSINASSVTGTISSSDPTISINDSIASYPDIASGAHQICTDCYNVTPQIGRPSTHWDFIISEAPTCTECVPAASYNYRYHVGNSFPDVPPSDMFYSYIEKILHANITNGCTATTYCPSELIPRQQMAKFICNSMQAVSAGKCSPGACTQRFTDVPASNSFCPYIEALYDAGVVSECQTSPLMYYCPAYNMKRQELAKILCLAMNEITLGSCAMNPCSGTFSDVFSSNPFCTYIEGIYNAAVIIGCQSSPLLYCPASNITRGQIAKFLVDAFHFSL